MRSICSPSRSRGAVHPRAATRAAALAGVLSVALSLTWLAGCASEPQDPADEAAETEAVSLPDLADDRELTSLASYQDRLSFFDDHAPVPAENLVYTVGDYGVSVSGYTGRASVVVLPSEIEGKPLTSIARRAFRDCEGLEALSIPATVTDMAFGALEGCGSLKTLQLPMAGASGIIHFGSLFGAETYETNAAHVPDSLSTLILTGGERIAPYAFYDCPMEAVFLPDSITEIGEFAFYRNGDLAYIPLVDLPLVSVGDWAFCNCSSLLSLELPATLERMGFAMLEGCGSLESLTLPFVGEERDAPASAETETGREGWASNHLGYLFGARAYMHAAGYIPASLIRVTLSEGCTEIPPNAFFECASVREVILPRGVTTIGHRAFYGCARLSSVTLPAGVSTIGEDAFHGCIRLTEVTAEEGLTTLGVQAFMDCISLRTVTLPASLISLPNAAFAGCRSLETLTAPGVVTYGNQVFRHCDKLVGWDEIK